MKAMKVCVENLVFTCLLIVKVCVVECEVIKQSNLKWFDHMKNGRR